MSSPDVIVVGAGAAGVGAAMMLERLAIPCLVLEAQDRLGGRAFTDHLNGVPFDAGCHWFHSADKNPLRALADRLGHAYRKPGAWKARPYFVNGQWAGRDLQGVLDDYVWGTFDQLAEAGRTGEDRSAADAVDLSGPFGRLRSHWIELMSSVAPSEWSVIDQSRYDDTHVNLAVEDGYGRLVERLAENLPIRTGAPVTRIETLPNGVRIHGPFGTLEAKAAIVTVPLAVLAAGAIAFDPPLDPSLLTALEGVRMGHYEKTIIAFDRLCLDIPDNDGSPYCDIIDNANPGDHPANVQVHPFGRPVAMIDMAGATVREMLARDGSAGLVSHATERLAYAFGNSIRDRIIASTTTGWGANAFIRGAYSAARPGRADERRRLAEGVNERVMLAGEGTSLDAMATAHGAFLTGIDRARRAGRLLGRQDAEPAVLWS